MQADALTAQSPSHPAGGTRHVAAELGGQLGFLEHRFSNRFSLNLVICMDIVSPRHTKTHGPRLSWVNFLKAQSLLSELVVPVVSPLTGDNI